jgi:hypothetical protein
MLLASTLDVYETALLAGGPDRAVDTAVVALVETGRVRVRGTGQLSVVEPRPGHQIEAVVIAAIGTRGYRTIDAVRYQAGKDSRLAAAADRLTAAGLLRRRRLPGYRRRGVTPTTAGRRALRELRPGDLDGSVTLGTSAAKVAVGGPDRMTDPLLRDALFH